MSRDSPEKQIASHLLKLAAGYPKIPTTLPRQSSLSTQPAMATNLPPPVCLALILCDYVHVDPASGKQTIIGTFSEVCFDGFPASLPYLCIYFCLTEGYREVPIKIRIVDVNEDRPPIFEANEIIEFANPKDPVQQSVHIRRMPFKEPGEYRVQLFAGEHFLLDRMLNVVGPVG